MKGQALKTMRTRAREKTMKNAREMATHSTEATAQITLWS